MRVFLVAGEASGDALGAALIDGLTALAPETRFMGVGGAAMEARGLQSLFPMTDLSVMGLAEILPRYLHLRRRLTQTVEAASAARPDVLITIDSPDFGLRVAKRVRARHPVRTVHYVAPSVWAWRPGRAQAMAPFIDQVLALLPFEPPYMEAAGIRCDFVGHPIATEPRADPAAVAAFRQARADGGARIVTVLPGSRGSEVARLAPVFGAALARLGTGGRRLRVIVPAAPGVAAAVRAQVAGWPGAEVIDGGDDALKRVAFAASDAALAASGTVSLQLAAAGTPMVIAYDMNPLSRAIVSRLLRVGTVTLVNLVTGRRDVPECLGRDCTPERIAAELSAVLDDPAAQSAALRETMRALGQGGEDPGLRAARAVLDGLR